jgi:chromate transporter
MMQWKQKKITGSSPAERTSMNKTDTPANNSKDSLWSLFITFAKVGVMTFGGGYAMLPILQREVVENKGWATDEELTDYFAIGQCTPGVIAVNTATFIGYKFHGVIGGIIATLGVIFPSLCIISALAGCISVFSGLAAVKNAFAAIRVCVCILIFNAVAKLFKSSVRDALTLTIFLAVTLCSWFLNLSPVIFVLAAAVAGVVYELITARGAANKKGGDLK